MDGYSLVKLYYVTECSFTEGQMGDYGHSYHTKEYYTTKQAAEQRILELGGKRNRDGFARKLEEVVLVKKGEKYYDLLISVYNDSEIVKSVFRVLNASEKLWLIFP